MNRKKFANRMRFPIKLGVDFDGTIVEHAFPEIGKPLPGAIEALKFLQVQGFRITLWTCREDVPGERMYLTEAVEFLKGHGVELRAVNYTHPDDEFRSPSGRKVYADIYIDDRNLGGFPGWFEVLRQLGFSVQKTKQVLKLFPEEVT